MRTLLSLALALPALATFNAQAASNANKTSLSQPSAPVLYDCIATPRFYSIVSPHIPGYGSSSNIEIAKKAAIKECQQRNVFGVQSNCKISDCYTKLGDDQ